MNNKDIAYQKLIRLLLGQNLPSHAMYKIDLAKSPIEQILYEKPLDFLYRILEYYSTQTGAKVFYGGYLEKRIYYSQSSHYHDENNHRNIHLGLDVWAPALTPIFSPVSGRIHSYNYNNNYLDYGATIIIETSEGEKLLFGHMSLDSIEKLANGSPISKGELVGYLGDVSENGGWPPHLHLQRILSMDGKEGDYPGVVSEFEVEHYTSNCPDPVGLIVE